MPFCKSCGANLEADAKFCTKCGTSVGVSEATQQKPRTPVKWTPLKIVGVVAVGVLLILLGTCVISLLSTPTPKDIDLNAVVRFDGTQFTIVNNDSFDWLDVKFELNSPGLFADGYILRASRMSAQATHTVGAMQFAKADGTRFNPYTMKANQITISCKTPDGDNGFWSGAWR